MAIIVRTYLQCDACKAESEFYSTSHKYGHRQIMEAAANRGWKHYFPKIGYVREKFYRCPSCAINHEAEKQSGK